jgi:hypothetical protein
MRLAFPRVTLSDLSDSIGSFAVNHHHTRTLHAIFAHPAGANIDFKDVESLLRALGAEVENKHGRGIGVALKGRSAAFHHADHDVPKAEVFRIRKFLETCGIRPDDHPL